MTTCTWDREGKRIAGGIGDGSIQVPFFFCFLDLLFQIMHDECLGCFWIWRKLELLICVEFVKVSYSYLISFSHRYGTLNLDGAAVRTYTLKKVIQMILQD